ncbi:right-handed parallel beta-helix repeat-containing protein [Streptomyces sp. NPDC057382]|uniref:right-handed parallel beta-helix repeat-containing protein n=1 Tax=unclassified Streptomyces TaxID=2593676 RepID=UPI003640BF2C
MTTFDIELYVSPGDGSAGGDGSSERPLAGLEAARDELRARRTPGQSAVVHVAAGHYRLETPLTFEPSDSATTYLADGHDVRVEGGLVLRDWTEVPVGDAVLWAADAPADRHIRSLFVDGERRARTRRPREGLFRVAHQDGLDLMRGSHETQYQGSDTFGFTPGDIEAYDALRDVEVVIPHYWIQERLPIAEVDLETSTVRCARRSVFALRDDISGSFANYYLENVREALGEVAGEWYYDRAAHRVLYVPRPGERRETFTATVPVLDELLLVHGEEDRPVTDLHFEGFTFAYTDWSLQRRTLSDSPGRLSDQIAYGSAPQAATDVTGALEFRHTTDSSLVNCVVEHVGGHAVSLEAGSSRIAVTHNTLRDLGGGGIAVTGGASEAAGLSRDNVLTDNEIVTGGRVFPAAVGILVRHSAGNTISHNHIHDLHYSGISCGWTWGYRDGVARDNVIEYNHIHDIGHGTMSDMGGVYLLGVQPGTVVRRNLIHGIQCANYGGWCVYLDEGSSHIVVEENVCFDASTQCLHQHYGRENTIRNNVFAFGARGLIAVTRAEEHVSFTLERNVLVSAGVPAIVGGTGAAHPYDVRLISDLNLFWDTRADTAMSGEGRVDATAPDEVLTPLSDDAWRAQGHDRHSVIGDVGLVLPGPDRAGGPSVSRERAAEIGFVMPDLTGVGPRSRPGKQ